jgi:hypothetical protein
LKEVSIFIGLFFELFGIANGDNLISLAAEGHDPAFPITRKRQQEGLMSKGQNDQTAK